MIETKFRFQGVFNNQGWVAQLTLKDVLRVIDATVTDAIEFPGMDTDLRVLEHELREFVKRVDDLKAAVGLSIIEDAKDKEREQTEEQRQARKQELRDIEISQRIEAQSLDRF